MIGHPVRHSLSPVILNAAFAELALDWVFVAFEVAEGGATDAVAAARALGLGGLSVTMPHKAAVIPALDELSPGAARLGAVNCIARRGERLIGHNTDGDGLVRSLAAEGVEVAGRRCVVLGSGGAARSIVGGLADAGASEVAVLARRADAAAATASLIPGIGRVGDAGALAGADLVVNATPVGMVGAAPVGFPADPAALGPSAVVVDIVYEPPVTAWMQALVDRGHRVIGGLPMLVGQAALAVELWTGAEAPVDVMTRAAEMALADRR